MLIIPKAVRISLVHAKSLQSCPTLCDPIDSSPPGSAVPGILQARSELVKAKPLIQIQAIGLWPEVFPPHHLLIHSFIYMVHYSIYSDLAKTSTACSQAWFKALSTLHSLASFSVN